MTGSLLATLYRGATDLGEPLIRRWLDRRLARGKEDRERFPERLGDPSLPRPAGPLVWLHGASVGESVSALPLIERLVATRPDLHVLVTTGTVTSARLMHDRLPHRALHQYVPVDRAAWVRRFLDHWRPDLGLWMESEFWPNLLGETAKRGIPLVLLNGRVSEKSYRNWQRAPAFIGGMLGAFDLCLGQTDADARRLKDLGAPRAECLGNLKFSAAPLPADAGKLDALATAAGDRPLWLAASTHEGEELMAWRLHCVLKAIHPGLLTVVVPRHPDRGEQVRADLQCHGARVRMRSHGHLPDATTDVYLADTLGELGLFYRLCPVTFVGKSLIGRGGQNPLEPARLGSAVVFGPHMANFADIAARMIHAGAARQVADEDALASEIGRLLTNAGARAALGEAGRRFAGTEAGALDRVLERLGPLLDRVAPAPGAPAPEGAQDARA